MMSLTCAELGKHFHASRSEAEAQLRSVKKREPEYAGRVYPCVCCRGFHVGRAKKQAHKNKYESLNK